MLTRFNPVAALHEILTIGNIASIFCVYSINFFSVRTNVNSRARRIEERIECPPSSACIIDRASSNVILARDESSRSWTRLAPSLHTYVIAWISGAPGGSFSFRFTTIYDSKIITNWIFFSFFLRLFLQNIEYSVWNYSHLEDDELGRVPFLLSNLKVLENLNELDEMNLRTGSAIHWTTRFWEVCWEKLFTCPENHYILITNIARCSLEIVGKFWIYVIVYFITYIRAKSCAVRREWLIDERSNIWFSFSFSSQILTLSRNLSKRNSLTTPPFDSTNHTTNRFRTDFEKREKKETGENSSSFLVSSRWTKHTFHRNSRLLERGKRKEGERAKTTTKRVKEE